MLPKDFQPARYQELLNEKVAMVIPHFEAMDAPEPQVFPSPTHSFRMRAEFRVWHDGKDLNFVMFESGRPLEPIEITAFPFGSKKMQAVLEPLRALLQGNAILRTKLFQVELLTTLSGECLVTLIYHRQLDDAWVQEATQVEKILKIIDFWLQKRSPNPTKIRFFDCFFSNEFLMRFWRDFWWH